ncbi:alpha-1-acid glycoprotein 1-like [Alca torda]
MASAGVATAVLGLAVLLLPTAATPRPAPRPTDTTASKLLGTWLYVAGAAQLPQHLLEMLLIDHGHLHVEPGAGERELHVTQRVAVGDQCLTNNSTYFEIAAGNATLVKLAKTHQTVGTLVNLSSEDVLLIQHELQRGRTYLGLYLYARNLSAGTAHREELEHHARRLGLGEEEMVFAPWKRELCQAEEMEKGTSPRLEPAVAATPPVGPHRPGGAGD